VSPQQTGFISSAVTRTVYQLNQRNCNDCRYFQ